MISMEDKKIKTSKFRVSYPQLGEAKSFGDGGPKYGITMLFPETLDLKAPVMSPKTGKQISIGILKALENAATEAWGANAEAMIAKIKKAPKGWPIRHGNKDKPDQPEYAGHYFISASRKEEKGPPDLVDHAREPITAADVYAGCYARAELIAYAYDNKFGKGLGFTLLNIQKVGEGKKFSGKKAARDVFEDIDPESDEDLGEETDAVGETNDDGY